MVSVCLSRDGKVIAINCGQKDFSETSAIFVVDDMAAFLSKGKSIKNVWIY